MRRKTHPFGYLLSYVDRHKMTRFDILARAYRERQSFILREYKIVKATRAEARLLLNVNPADLTAQRRFYRVTQRWQAICDERTVLKRALERLQHIEIAKWEKQTKAFRERA